LAWSIVEESDVICLKNCVYGEYIGFVLENFNSPFQGFGETNRCPLG